MARAYGMLKCARCGGEVPRLSYVHKFCKACKKVVRRESRERFMSDPERAARRRAADALRSRKRRLRGLVKKRLYVPRAELPPDELERIRAFYRSRYHSGGWAYYSARSKSAKEMLYRRDYLTDMRNAKRFFRALAMSGAVMVAAT